MRNKATGKLHILLLDQGRQSLPFLRSYSKAGHHIVVVCNTRLSESYFSRYPSKKLLWPSYMKNRPAFEAKLMDYLKNNQVDLTVSVGDVTSDILSKNKQEISRYTRITSPDYSTFLMGANKLKVMQYCMDHGLPCPKTFVLTEENMKDIEKLLDFPVMVKPTRGVGAVGVIRYDKAEKLREVYQDLTGKYGEMIVQEFIPQEGGMQYQAEAFVDEKHKMKVCMTILKPRFFPVNGGTSTANVSIGHPEIEDTTRALLEGLKWKGAADVDFILDPRDQKAKILEINPRVTAGIKIGFIAGIDYADLTRRLAFGEEVPEIKNYRHGVYCRNFFLEVLWFLYADRKMRRNTSPRFFKPYGRYVVDQLFSWNDPFAALGFFLNMLRKYLNITNFKAKFHK
jgi:D-aspartate ligase